MKSRFRSLWSLLVKIIFLSVAAYAIFNNISHEGRAMTSEDLTSVGLNSFYFINYDFRVKIDTSKILFLSAVVLTYYALTIAKFNNFYEGLKETIRIKSSSLYDYIKKSIQFFIIPVLVDVIISAAIISLVIIFANVEHGLSVITIQQILLMSLFYSVMPFLLMFIVDRIEFFLVGIFTLSIFADYFVYKLPLYGIAGLYLLTIATAYGIILFKERKA